MLENLSKLANMPLKIKNPDSQLEEVLENNDLKKLNIPKEGKNNLYKALSFAIFFSLNEENYVLSKLISHLKILIQEKRLPLKLGIFENNLSHFKDYCSNPYFHGFDKVSLELASHCFELKIVVYFLSEENYLNSTIYNNKFEKTIFLWKTGTHFDVAFDAQKYAVMSFAQNLVYEFLFGVLGTKRDTNKPYFIAHHESVYDKSELFLFDYPFPPPSQENKLKPTHKKSRSDNFNNMNEKNEKKNDFYNIFLNLEAPKDFFINITPSHSSRFAKHFNSKPELKNRSQEFVFPTKKENSDQPNANISNLISEMFSSETEKNKPPLINNKRMFFTATTPPPGLTPKKDIASLNKPNEEDFQIYQNRPNFEIPENLKNFSNIPSQFTDNSYRGAAKNNIFSLYSNPNTEQENNNVFNLPQKLASQMPDLNTPNQNFAYSQFVQNMQNPPPAEETKKMINFDSRKTGRLKFFDEAKNYGFIIMDEDGSDIFVHFDDLAKAGISKELLRTAKQGNLIRFSFNCMNYIGKYNKSKKAVDISMINNSFI